MSGERGGGLVHPRVQVALGGAFGATVRASVVAAVGIGATGWPWGVLAVNLVGALLLGVVVGGAPRSVGLARWAPLLGTGIAGSLTTFSALAVDLAQLTTSRPGVAWGYAAVSLVGGAALAWLGLRIGQGRAGDRL